MVDVGDSQSSLLQYLDQLEANFMARIGQLEASLGISPDRFLVSAQQVQDTLARVALASGLVRNLRTIVAGIQVDSPGQATGARANTVDEEENRQMSTPSNPLDSVNAAVDKLTTDIATATTDLQAKLQAVAAEVAALKAGTPVTQAQIDALNAKLAAADASVAAIDSSVTSFNP